MILIKTPGVGFCHQVRWRRAKTNDRKEGVLQRRLRTTALIATALAGIALPQYASAACGHEAVSVSGTAEEVADACRALDEVVSYFRKIGFRPAPDIRISFRDHVYIDMYVPAGKEPVGRERSVGSLRLPSQGTPDHVRTA